MNKPPKEITTPPEGYEWTGEGRTATSGEYTASWDYSAMKWIAHYRPLGSVFRYAILRRITPAKLMVELPREVVERHADYTANQLGMACRAALDSEDAQ